jgi:hypothetical protein
MYGRPKLLGAVALIVLMTLGVGCIVAGPEGPRRPVNVPPPPPPGPGYDPDEDYGVFYDGLAPYGDWFWLDPYGWVWDPARVAPGWRPYTVGHWIYTDDGWFWKSDEPWGWATCHYGRWLFDSYRGWIWVPGHEWAPSWVAWRYGDGWLGWAPLPPRAVFRAGIGLDLGGVDLEVMIDPFWWLFVADRDIFDSRISIRIVPPARNVTLVRLTRNVTRYGVERSRVVVHGADLAAIERARGRRITPYHIVDERNSGPDRHSRVVGQELRVFRPAMKDPPPSRVPRGTVRHDVPAPTMESPGPAVGTRPQHGRPEEAPPRAAPERPAPVSPEVLKRQQAEQRELERRQAAERSRLEQLHRKEARKAPPVAPPEELEKRHSEEQRAMDEQARREKTLLEKKQEREREAKPAESSKEKEKGRKEKDRDRSAERKKN